jgi:hypothetical protein
MFHGHWQESKKEPHDSILMENVNPEAFDVAMRYVVMFILCVRKGFKILHIEPELKRSK